MPWGFNYLGRYPELVEMPGSRILHTPVDGKYGYYANPPSSAIPDGFGEEETMLAIWAADL